LAVFDVGVDILTSFVVVTSNYGILIGVYDVGSIASMSGESQTESSNAKTENEDRFEVHDKYADELMSKLAKMRSSVKICPNRNQDLTTTLSVLDAGVSILTSFVTIA
jgi:hypothetical protein